MVSFRIMAVTDTTPHAAEVQLKLYQQVGPSRRATIAAELSDAVRETSLAGLRRRHPEYSDDELARAFLRFVYGYEKSR